MESEGGIIGGPPFYLGGSAGVDGLTKSII
jgi:hypothetical protein